MTLQTPLRKGLHPEGAPRDPWSRANRKDPMDTNGQVPKADRGVNHDTPPKASTCSRNQDAGKCSLVSQVDNRMRPSRQLGEVRSIAPTHALSVSGCRRRQALEHSAPGTASAVPPPSSISLQDPPGSGTRVRAGLAHSAAACVRQSASPNRRTSIGPGL